MPELRHVTHAIIDPPDMTAPTEVWEDFLAGLLRARQQREEAGEIDVVVESSIREAENMLALRQELGWDGSQDLATPLSKELPLSPHPERTRRRRT